MPRGDEPFDIDPAIIPQITTKRLVGRALAIQGPCPECGRPSMHVIAGGPVVEHHDPIDHAACPLTIAHQRMNRILVEGAKRLDYLDLLDGPYPQTTMDAHIRELVDRQYRAIEAELMAIPPGYRLCMHDAVEMMSGQDDEAFHLDQDIHIIRVRQRGHVLEPGEACRHHGTRMEYGWPAGAIVARLGPCGRPDDCRLIEATDGTRYWFRSHGCPVAELPPREWSKLDDLAAQAQAAADAEACGFIMGGVFDPDTKAAAAALAESIDNALCSLLTGPIEPAKPLTYEEIVELYNRLMANREYRPDPGPPPYPPAALRSLWAYTATRLPPGPSALGSIND